MKGSKKVGNDLNVGKELKNVSCTSFIYMFTHLHHLMGFSLAYCSLPPFVLLKEKSIQKYLHILATNK